MTGHELDAIRRFTVGLTEEARGSLTRTRLFRTRSKRDALDVVTHLDERIERRIRTALARRFPHHALVGEEEGGRYDPHRPTWFIDPVDGTRELVRGVPLYATALALCEGDRVLASSITYPDLGETYSAAYGRGAFRNRTRIRVSQVHDPRSAMVSATVNGTDQQRNEAFRRVPGLARAVYRLRVLPGDLLSLCWMSRGGYDAFLHLSRTWHPWDVLAGWGIAREAGARCYPTDPLTLLRRGQLGRFVVANPVLAKKLVWFVLPA